MESEYDELGKPTVTIDNTANIVYNYKYGELGEIVEEKRNNTSFKLLEYDEHRRLERTTVHASDETLVYTPIYDTREDGVIYADNVLKGMRLEGVFTQSVDKDKHGRPTRSSLSVGDTSLLETEFGYLAENNRLTTIVERLTHRVCGTEQNAYTYTYDANGNITAVHDKQNALIVSYVYDGLNRLTRENNFVLGKTYTYRYDAAGNILCKSTYAVTSGAVVTPETVKLYGYASEGWKDRLISYDGTAITYDDAGNPLLYRGHTLGWSRIRLLTSWDSLSFAYNANGIRTRKGETTYELDGDSIISETTNGSTIRYYYGNGGIVGFRYNGARYYYEKNLQGDITAIYSESGQLVGAYTYDAWGNHTIDCDVNGIATVNPFRYRAYYYDTETGLYYVNSRYYDPEVGRWINADEYIFTGQGVLCTNMFAYCGNNPVSRVDYTGLFWKAICEFSEIATAEIQNTMRVMAPAYVGCSGVALADGPLPVGDIIALAGVALLTIGAIGLGTYQAAHAPAISIPKTKEKPEVISIPKKPNSLVIFPVDPNAFNPVGLVKVPRTGTKNGAFISWMEPLSNTEVFRWDENPNYSNGPHYHIHGKGHYYPGTIVPEPFATIYFPFR